MSFRNAVTEELMVSAAFAMEPNKTVKAYFKLDCVAGKTLKAIIEDGDTDFEIDISIDDITYYDAFTTGLDLTPYDGTRQIIIVRVSSAADFEFTSDNFIWTLV